MGLEIVCRQRSKHSQYKIPIFWWVDWDTNQIQNILLYREKVKLKYRFVYNNWNMHIKPMEV